jgi:hypothetical protein
MFKEQGDQVFLGPNGTVDKSLMSRKQGFCPKHQAKMHVEIIAIDSARVLEFLHTRINLENMQKDVDITSWTI